MIAQLLGDRDPAPLGIPYLPSLEIRGDLGHQMLNQWRAFWGARTVSCRAT
jgi:hypothetical protein